MFMVVMIMVMFVFVRVLMLVMVIAVASFFLAIDEYRHVRAGDAAFHGRFCYISDARDPARIQFLNKCFTLFFRKKLEKRCAQHVARGAHGTVDIQNLHFFASIWLIMLAR